MNLTVLLKNSNRLFSQIPLLLKCERVAVSTIQIHLCVTSSKSHLRKQPERWEFVFASPGDSRGSVFLGLSVVLQLADKGRSCVILRSVSLAAPSPGKFPGMVLDVIPGGSV